MSNARENVNKLNDIISVRDYGARGDGVAPAANQAVVYARDNGSGKTQLCVRFNTGAVQVLATEP